MKENQKSDGLIAFLSSLLKKSEEVPSDVGILMGSIRVLTDKLKDVAESVTLLAIALEEHNKAIEELYNVQEMIVRKFEKNGVDSSVDFPMNKTKTEKPN